MFQIDGHVHERHNSAFLLATVAMLIDSAFSAHAQNIMRQHIQACCSRSSQDADAAYVLYRALVFNGTSLNFNFFSRLPIHLLMSTHNIHVYREAGTTA